MVENEAIGMRRARLQDGVVTNGVLDCAGGGEEIVGNEAA